MRAIIEEIEFSISFSNHRRTYVMINKVILVGNLGRDPEVRFTTSGNPVTNFSLATHRRWRDAGGECIFRRFRPPVPEQSDQVPERVDAGVLLGLEVVGLRRRRCRDATAHERVAEMARRPSVMSAPPRMVHADVGPQPSMSPDCAPHLNSASASAGGVLTAGGWARPLGRLWHRGDHQPSALA